MKTGPFIALIIGYLFEGSSAFASSSLEENERGISSFIPSLSYEDTNQRNLQTDMSGNALNTTDPISSLPNELILRIAAFLNMQDLCKLEEMSRKFYSVLHDAYQYLSFTIGFSPKLDSSTELSCAFKSWSYKQKFLYLWKENPNFRIHWTDLWRNYFPAPSTLNFGLTHYWQNLTTPEQLATMNTLYNDYLKLYKLPEKASDLLYEERSEYISRARLGQILTNHEKVRYYVHEQGKPCYDEHRLELIRMSTIERHSPELKNAVDLAFVEVDFVCFKRFLSFQEARDKVRHVFKSPTADSVIKIRALYNLAKIDLLDKDSNVTNYSAARDGFTSVLNSSVANPHLRAKAEFELAKMNHLGLDLEKPNYSAARYGFNTVLNNTAADLEGKSKAQLWIADMDYFGQGLEQPSYSAACKGFVKVIKGCGMSTEKISALEKLIALATSRSTDTQIKLKTREGLIAGYYLQGLSCKIRMEIQFIVADLDRLSQDSAALNYSTTREWFKSILNSQIVFLQERKRAQYCLAVMDQLGRGIERPNISAAQEGFIDVMNSPDTDEKTKSRAQIKLLMMTRAHNSNNER